MRRQTVHDGSGVIEEVPGYGITRAYGTAVPTGAGYAPGCLFIKITGSAGDVIHVNNGTVTSASFSAIPTAGTTGAADVGIADAGSFTANTTVEAALQEIFQHLISTGVTVPLPIQDFRSVSTSKDVGTTAAGAGNGTGSGVMASNSTPALQATATTEHLGITWVTGDVVQIAIGITLPEDIDDTQDAYVDLYVQANTTDQAPTFTVETSWISANASGVGTLGSLVTDTATAVTSTGVQELTATIASGDVPAGAVALTLGLVPATHGTSEFILYGARLRYKGKLRTV